MTLRVTTELAELLRETEAHTGLSVSEIARAVMTGLRRGRVTQPENSACVTSSGAAFLRVRGVDLPDGVTAGQFREALAARCREALAKPGERKFVTTAREGVDYVLED